MFRHEGQLLRAIFAPAIDDFAFLESSGLLEKLVSSGALVAPGTGRGVQTKRIAVGPATPGASGGLSSVTVPAWNVFTPQPFALANAPSGTVFKMPALSGSWARCLEGLRHPHTLQIRPITFDHASATAGAGSSAASSLVPASGI